MRGVYTYHFHVIFRLAGISQFIAPDNEIFSAPIVLTVLMQKRPVQAQRPDWSIDMSSTNGFFLNRYLLTVVLIIHRGPFFEISLVIWPLSARSCRNASLSSRAVCESSANSREVKVLYFENNFFQSVSAGAFFTSGNCL